MAPGKGACVPRGPGPLSGGSALDDHSREMGSRPVGYTGVMSVPAAIVALPVFRGTRDAATGRFAIRLHALMRLPESGLDDTVRTTLFLHGPGRRSPLEVPLAGIRAPTGPTTLFGETALAPGRYTIMERRRGTPFVHFLLQKDPRLPIRVFCHHHTRTPSSRDRYSVISWKGDPIATHSVLRFGSCCMAPGQIAAPLTHNPPVWVFLQPLAQKQELWIGGERMKIRPDEYLLLDPLVHPPFEKAQPTPGPFKVIWFRPAVFEGLWRSFAMPFPLKSLRFPRGPHRINTDVTGALAALEETLAQTDAHVADQAAEIACYTMILALLRSHPVPSEKPLPKPAKTSSETDPRLTRAMTYLEEHYFEPYEAHAVARFACASPQVLWRLFQKHLGQTPTDHLQTLRVERAKRLLADPELTVDEIARRVGYGNTRSFRRIFLARAAQPMSAFR